MYQPNIAICDLCAFSQSKQYKRIGLLACLALILSFAASISPTRLMAQTGGEAGQPQLAGRPVHLLFGRLKNVFMYLVSRISGADFWCSRVPRVIGRSGVRSLCHVLLRQ